MISRRPGQVAYEPANWGITRSRISWGAVLAGALTAVASSLLLSLLGASLGAGWVQPFNVWSDLAKLSTGAVLWGIVNLGLSMLVGGYVAARLSGTHSHQDAELHGLTTWATATLLGGVLAAWLLGGIASIVGQGLGSMMSGTAREAADAAMRLVAPEASPRALTDRLRQSLGSSDDVTTMSREQIGAEINALIQSSLTRDLSDQDYDRLVALAAAQYGVTREEAARRVTRLENDAKASREQIAQKAAVAADTIAQGTATAARALFTALTTGLLGSLIGAWLGTRHKRALHPPEQPSYAPRPAYGTTEHAIGAAGAGTGYRTAVGYAASRERATPSSVSVHDESGRLASEYLRGVTFPVTKQDLLRLARASSAGLGALQAIEAMPEGYYGSIHEVIEALDMEHTT